MREFILDASVALAWFVDRPTPEYAIHVRQEMRTGARAIVPWLWLPEVANGLVVSQRRGVLQPEAVDRSINVLEDLLSGSISVHSMVPLIRQVWQTAQTFQLSCYDAIYLEIATGERMQLATLDKRLRVAAEHAGVRLFH